MVVTQEEQDRAHQAIEVLQQGLLTSQPDFNLAEIARAIAWLQRLGEQQLLADGL